MCGSMADIQSAAAEIRRGKKEEEERTNHSMKIYMVCPVPQGDHKLAEKGTMCILYEFTNRMKLMLSDELFSDGRPAPLWPREIKRREKQKDLAVSYVATQLYIVSEKTSHL